MATLVDALAAALTAENEIIERLLELGEAKRHALQNAEKVSAIAQEEEECLIRLDAVERERLVLTEAFAGSKTAEDLLAHLGDDRPDVRELLQRLAENLRRLQDINELNQELLRESLRFVQFSINALSGDVAITYDRTGPAPSGTSTFDRKV